MIMPNSLKMMNQYIDLLIMGLPYITVRQKKYPDILQGKVKCDNLNETLDVELEETDLLVLVYFMCFIVASNKYTEYTSLWGTIANETGLKDYKSNCSAKKEAMDYFKNQIDSLIEDEIISFN